MTTFVYNGLVVAKLCNSNYNSIHPLLVKARGIINKIIFVLYEKYANPKNSKT